jgi:hypothetical protein
MAMTLQEAIDFASVHADTDPYGIECYATISMHDDADLSATVLFGGAMFPTFTFRPDLRCSIGERRPSAAVELRSASGAGSGGRKYRDFPPGDRAARP